MTWQTIVKLLWPIALMLFLGISVSQISERLKRKVPTFGATQPHNATIAEQQHYNAPPTRATAMLGGACVILAAFWGFDVMLSWLLYASS